MLCLHITVSLVKVKIRYEIITKSRNSSRNFTHRTSAGKSKEGQGPKVNILSLFNVFPLIADSSGTFKYLLRGSLNGSKPGRV